MVDLKEINRRIIGFEVRLTIDQLLDNRGAKLVNQQGRAINICPKTAALYLELRSMIEDYERVHGTNLELQEVRDKWSLPSESKFYS